MNDLLAGYSDDSSDSDVGKAGSIASDDSSDDDSDFNDGTDADSSSSTDSDDDSDGGSDSNNENEDAATDDLNHDDAEVPRGDADTHPNPNPAKADDTFTQMELTAHTLADATGPSGTVKEVGVDLRYVGGFVCLDADAKLLSEYAENGYADRWCCQSLRCLQG